MVIFSGLTSTHQFSNSYSAENTAFSSGFLLSFAKLDGCSLFKPARYSIFNRNTRFCII